MSEAEVDHAAAAAAQANEDARMMREAAEDPTAIHVKLDAEFEKKNYLKVHQKLTEVFFLNPNLETGWRLTRVCYLLSVKAAGQHELNYLKEGWTAATKYLAMEGGQEHPDARKWAGIILGSVADNYDNNKEKVAATEKIRGHLEASLKVRSNDPVTLHAMGMYCFQVAGIGWMEKAAAKVIFGKELSSSYSEALVHFAKAKEVSPTMEGKPWFKNDWMIAQCLVKSKKSKDVAGATQLIKGILSDEEGKTQFGEDIEEFCKKKKIKL